MSHATTTEKNVEISRRQEVDRVFSILGITWDEEKATRRLADAYKGADRLCRSKPWRWEKCWSWCRFHYPELRDEMDRALDTIDRAFVTKHPGTLHEGLEIFRNTIDRAWRSFNPKPDRKNYAVNAVSQDLPEILTERRAKP